MTDYVAGAGTFACLAGIAAMINAHIPNGIFYYVDLMLPF